jgi:hypothetical protein
MRYEDGRLSLEAKDASLDKVLNELARMAMLTIISDGPLEDRITVYADRLPLEKALRRILRGKDTSFVYAARDKASPIEYDVREVRIYLATADKGEARRYSYSQRSEEAERVPSPPESRAEFSRNRHVRPRPTAAAPRIPDAATTDEAKQLISELMDGDLEGAAEIAERFKDLRPQHEGQIEEFLESLEEVRRRAEESGLETTPLEGLGDMQTLMKQMMRNGRMPAPGQERE